MFKPASSRLAEVAQVVHLDSRGHSQSDRGDPSPTRFPGHPAKLTTTGTCCSTCCETSCLSARGLLSARDPSGTNAHS